MAEESDLEIGEPESPGRLEKAHRPRQLRQPMPLPRPKPKIVLVELEVVAAPGVERQLSELGYLLVGIATRAEQAIELVAALHPDLVLIDIQLAAAVDGIAATQAIRTRFALPVVFLTTFAADEMLARASLTEPFGYLLKPFTVRELGAVLAMALYKHQTEAKLLTSTRQLKALSQRVLEAQELERRRVAIELHDELGQSLTAIKINLQLSERFKDKSPADLNRENIRIVEDALQQVRHLASALRPSMLDDLGLAPALKWMAEQTASRAGFAVNFHHERVQSRLASEIETACFRIVQEALTNIARHAQARRVDIGLRREGDDMLLTVEDDGKGFDLTAMRERALAGGSLGVLGMQERATLLGGQLDIDSSPGRGSSLQLRCPWRMQAEAA